MNMNKKAQGITQTAVFTALLVILQAATGSAGQLVTGSCVNAVLAVAALCVGGSCGAVVALLSPFFAFLLGIGPQLVAIVPAIAAGNLVYVLVLWVLVGRKSVPVWQFVAGWLAASAGKFLTLYLLVVQLLCSVLPLKQPQIDKFSAMFSFPQLITALIGGGIALIICPILKKALKRR